MNKSELFESMPKGSSIIPIFDMYINKDTGKQEVEFTPNEEVRYILIKKLGEGTFGEVYKGYDKVTGELVAIKFQKAGENVNNNIKRGLLFEKEIRSLAKLSGNCGDFLCLRDYGLIQEKGVNTVYIILNHIEGMEMAEFIDNKGYDANDLLIIMKNLLRGVQTLHSIGVAHQDIKPANIMINPETLKVNIIDMGLICDEMLCGGSGTPSYMPLMVDANSNLQARQAVDYWALGLILLEFITKNNVSCANKCKLKMRNTGDILQFYRDFKKRTLSGNNIRAIQMIEIFDNDINLIFDQSFWDQKNSLNNTSNFSKNIKFGDILIDKTMKTRAASTKTLSLTLSNSDLMAESGMTSEMSI